MCPHFGFPGVSCLRVRCLTFWGSRRRRRNERNRSYLTRHYPSYNVRSCPSKSRDFLITQSMNVGGNFIVTVVISCASYNPYGVYSALGFGRER